tara:strand:- start:11735 stop:12595 length:861 start_codon:yes stop_codon:yes gene_type:complete
MKTVRIIPRLDIKGPNLVKGIHLEGLRAFGDPAIFAKYYYEDGADEILLMDVVASLYDRNSLHDLIKHISKDIFIPLTVGGGLRTVEDIKNVLRVGADKVILNTAAIKNPNLIKEAVNKFGSSTICIAIEAIKQPDDTYMAFTDNGREYTGLDVIKWANQIQKLGVGEIVLTSVDNEGTGQGFDLNFINQIADLSTVPIIVHGGAGNKENILKVLKNSKCDAVCAASIFHYETINKINPENLINTQNKIEGNFDFIKSGNTFKKIQATNIPDLKKFLRKNNIPVRY